MPPAPPRKHPLVAAASTRFATTRLCHELCTTTPNCGKPLLSHAADHRSDLPPHWLVKREPVNLLASADGTPFPRTTPNSSLRQTGSGSVPAQGLLVPTKRAGSALQPTARVHVLRSQERTGNWNLEQSAGPSKAQTPTTGRRRTRNGARVTEKLN